MFIYSQFVHSLKQFCYGKHAQYLRYLISQQRLKKTNLHKNTAYYSGKVKQSFNMLED